MKNRFLIGTLAVACCAAAAHAQETPIEMSDVPAEVMEAARDAASDLRLALDVAGPVDDGSVIDDNLVLVYEDLGPVTFVSANTEAEDGGFVYEIQGTFEGGRRVEVDLDPDGDVLEIEIEFEMDDVPGAVKKALAERLEGFTPEFIEASHSRGMQVLAYEFVGAVGGNAMDIEVSADGRTITVGDD